MACHSHLSIFHCSPKQNLCPRDTAGGEAGNGQRRRWVPKSPLLLSVLPRWDLGVPSHAPQWRDSSSLFKHILVLVLVLVLVVLGLCCWARAFSSCLGQELLFIAARGLLLLRNTGSRVAGRRSCGSWAMEHIGLLSCSSWAQQLPCAGRGLGSGCPSHYLPCGVWDPPRPGIELEGNLSQLSSGAPFRATVQSSPWLQDSVLMVGFLPSLCPRLVPHEHPPGF